MYVWIACYIYIFSFFQTEFTINLQWLQQHTHAHVQCINTYILWRLYLKRVVHRMRVYDKKIAVKSAEKNSHKISFLKKRIAEKGNNQTQKVLFVCKGDSNIKYKHLKKKRPNAATDDKIKFIRIVFFWF